MPSPNRVAGIWGERMNNDTCPNCKEYAHYNVELEEEIKVLTNKGNARLDISMIEQAAEQHSPNYPRTFELGAIWARDRINNDIVLLKDALNAIANLENVNTYVQLDESVKMAVNFYAREVLSKINTLC